MLGRRSRHQFSIFLWTRSNVSVAIITIAGLILAGSLTWPAVAQDTLLYGFAEGDLAKYRLSIVQRITIAGQGASSETVRYSYTYQQRVGRNRSGTASLDIDMLGVRFKMGTNARQFDSTIASHFEASKTNPPIWVYGAISTSKARMGIKPNGQVMYFRLVSVDSPFDDEQTKDMVTRSIEELKDHAFLTVPGTQIDGNQIWRTLVPIRLLGSLGLTGHTIFAPVTLSLDSIEGTGANRIARYSVRSFQTPDIGMTEGSLSDVKMELELRGLDGSVSFAIAKGQIENYEFRIRTKYVVTADGSLIQDHQMEEEVSLERLAN